MRKRHWVYVPRQQGRRSEEFRAPGRLLGQPVSGWQAVTVAPVVIALVLMGGAGARAAEQGTQDSPATTGANAPPPGGRVASVNGKPVAPELTGQMLRDLLATGGATEGNGDQVIAERLIVNELLVQEAVKSGLDRDPQVRARADMARRDVLANTVLSNYVAAHPVSEQQVRTEYERRKAELLGAKEYRLRHILVTDETVARDLIKQLVAGRDFEPLADDFSIDSGVARTQGGSLGWVSVDSTEKALIDAAAGLKVGEVSREPVHTRFGWHVLMLDGVRELRVLPYDSAASHLRQQLEQQLVQKWTEELRAKATVVWRQPSEPLGKPSKPVEAKPPQAKTGPSAAP